MIGLINISIQAFVVDTFGDEAWRKVVEGSGVTSTTWISSCPYPDSTTYDIVVTAASLLGISVNQALEAFGLYFVGYLEREVSSRRRHCQRAIGRAPRARPHPWPATWPATWPASWPATSQGFSKLLQCLGSNLAELLHNLNNLHQHIAISYPAAEAPSFRCENVGPLAPATGLVHLPGSAAVRLSACCSCTASRSRAGLACCATLAGDLHVAGPALCQPSARAGRADVRHHQGRGAGAVQHRGAGGPGEEQGGGPHTRGEQRSSPKRVQAGMVPGDAW